MAADAGTGALIEMGPGFWAMSFVVFVLHAALAASGREAVLSSGRAMLWLRRGFAASFALLGLKLAGARA